MLEEDYHALEVETWAECKESRVPKKVCGEGSDRPFNVSPIFG